MFFKALKIYGFMSEPDQRCCLKGPIILRYSREPLCTDLQIIWLFLNFCDEEQRKAKALTCHFQTLCKFDLILGDVMGVAVLAASQTGKQVEQVLSTE